MLAPGDLLKIAEARLRDAQVLAKDRRYDGSVYLCGYAVELALKVRICRTLKWAGFPETGREFEGYTSFRTHKLAVLLHLSGREAAIKARCFPEWSVVATWEPEVRYRPVGRATSTDAADMLRATRVVLAAL